MKKTLMTATAVSFMLANAILPSTATAGTVHTKNVIGFDSNMDAIYGTVKSDVRTLKVVSFDGKDHVYGDLDDRVKTRKVIGFDNDMEPIYQQ